MSADYECNNLRRNATATFTFADTASRCPYECKAIASFSFLLNEKLISYNKKWGYSVLCKSAFIRRQFLMSQSSRAGRWIQQPTGYRAFVPASLPPDPPLLLDDEMWTLLSRADRALGRLDGVTSILPNPDLFVAMYVRQEAVLSSQIEGTQSTLEDVLEFEAGAHNAQSPGDVEEIVNYIRAMNHGLKRLNEFPLSLPLIKEIHGILLEGTRGAGRDPGEFRRSQN